MLTSVARAYKTHAEARKGSRALTGLRRGSRAHGVRLGCRLGMGMIHE
jgi:hypothetical protein